MLEPGTLTTPAAAFTAGLVTSLHCALMCGPLACLLGPARGERVSAQSVSTVYHLARLAGYAVLGGIAGAIGSVPLAQLNASATRFLPWALVIFFVAVAGRVDRFLPRPSWLTRWQFRLHSAARSRSRRTAAAVIGGLTPLLPCGPLYLVVTLAAFSGTALRGVEFMLAFGLGTVPLLWLAQANFGWLRARLSARGVMHLRTIVALAAALVLAWRLRGTLGFAVPDAGHLFCHFP